jgi:hypothetical protein
MRLRKACCMRVVPCARSKEPAARDEDRMHACLWQDGILPGMVKERYSSYAKGLGKRIRDGKVMFMMAGQHGK